MRGNEENRVIHGRIRREEKGGDLNTVFMCKIHKRILNMAVIENTSACHYQLFLKIFTLRDERKQLVLTG